MKTKVIAIDLGASSGRLVECALEDGRMQVKEIYRFPNAGIRVNSRIYTDILYIYDNILKGLHACAREGGQYESAGIDAWGVDFGFLDSEGELTANPYQYRDLQSADMPAIFAGQFGEKGLFYETGVQNMWYNTVYQLMGIRRRKKDAFQNAATFLMTADILGYFLTGKCSLEYTGVSTTQMYDMKNKRWSQKILSKLGMDAALFPPVLETGSVKGEFLEEVQKQAGMMEGRVKLVATAQHDSASAAYAVPAKEGEYLFINSGTWSVLGTVLDGPIVNDAVFEHGFSNEGAAFGRIKLVKSIMGMWLVQEIRKCWRKKGMPADYDFLMEAAAQAEAFAGYMDVDDESFIAPADMEEAMAKYMAQTGQSEIRGQGGYYRVIMESLAFKYRQAIMELEDICQKKFEKIYLLGGAVQDRGFCQYIANATGKETVAGPVEATAAGNGMIQFLALGRVRKSDAAAIIRESFAVEKYRPQETELWKKNYENYLQVTKRAFLNGL